MSSTVNNPGINNNSSSSSDKDQSQNRHGTSTNQDKVSKDEEF